jgi:hypothetical protein
LWGEGAPSALFFCTMIRLIKMIILILSFSDGYFYPIAESLLNKSWHLHKKVIKSG